MNGNGGYSAAALGRVLALAIIPRAIGRNAKKPGLELRITLKSVQVLDNRQKNFLGDLLDIFSGEVGRQLENEPTRRGIMLIKKLVPGVSLALAAAGQQVGFGVRSHPMGNLKDRQEIASL